MNHTQIAVLRTEITRPPYDSLSYEQIVVALNAHPESTMPNPDPQSTIPVPVTMMDILNAALTHDPTNTPALIASLAPIADRFERDLTVRNQRAIAFYMTLYGAALNSAAQDAIQTLLSATQPDPTWTETITLTLPSRADDLGLPVVRTEDVQAALNLIEVA